MHTPEVCTIHVYCTHCALTAPLCHPCVCCLHALCVLQVPVFGSGQNAGGLKTLRTIRALRVVKLARLIK